MICEGDDDHMVVFRFLILKNFPNLVLSFTIVSSTLTQDSVKIMKKS